MKRDVFKEVGGFSGKQHVGDFELWHILGALHPMSIMSAGPGLWREHEDQQSNDNRTDPLVPFKYFLLGLEKVSEQSCPLDETEQASLVKKLERRLARTVLYSFKRNSIKDTFRLKKATGKTWVELVKDAFA